MKHSRRRARKSSVRRAWSTVDGSDLMILGAILVLTTLKCVAFAGVM